MKRFSRQKASENGAALILILSIVALLTILVVAFLGTSSKQVVDAKSASTAVEKSQLSEFATSQFLLDLKNEILAGSVSPAAPRAATASSASSAAGSPTLYPATPLSAVPDRYSAARDSNSGSPSAPVTTPPNLLKQSAAERDFYDKNLGMEGISGIEAQMAFPKADAYPPSSRASKVSTASTGNGAISAARWNRPLLLPRENSSAGDVFPEGYEPKRAGTYAARVAGGATSANWTWEPPDWIYVAGDGSNPKTFDRSLTTGQSNAVVGRYAFQAYDIGGLLDLNVAGYSPEDIPAKDAGKKGSTGLADLRQVGLSAEQIKALLKFRNPAIASKQGGGGAYGNTYINFLLKTPDPQGGAAAWPGSYGFMRVGNLGTVTNRAFSSRRELTSFLLGGLGTGNAPESGSSQTGALMDTLQYFTHFSRSLEQPSYKPGFYLRDSGGTRTRSNASIAGSSGGGPASLPDSPVFLRPSIVPPKDKVDDILYPIETVSTASPPPPTSPGQTVPLHRAYKLPYEMALGNNRGGNDAWGTLEERSFGGTPIRVATSRVAPPQTPRTTALQDVINPGFSEVRVLVPFRRLDNTQATVGEPLVKKRFPLERLSWLTYKGPSATLSSSDPMYNSLGTEDNILKAFGMVWTKADKNDPEKNSFWVYDHGRTGEILTLGEVASLQQPREPDFVELLYAAIAVGSVGKSAVAAHNQGSPWDTATYQQVRDRTSRFQILEIAANLIDQNDTDSFPTIIKLPNPYPNPDSSNVSATYPALFTARGVEDLPYFYRLQWRAVKNQNKNVPFLKANPDIDPPPFSVPSGILDITNLLSTDSNWSPSNFRCGTSSLILFPELWNPHAQGLQTPGSNPGPTEFRVVAASQSPGDVLCSSNPLSFSGAMAQLDRGLMNNPKLYDGTSFPTENSQRLWRDSTVNKNYSARTVGTFFCSHPYRFLGNIDLWAGLGSGENSNDWGSRIGYPLNPGNSFDFFPDNALFWARNDPVVGTQRVVGAFQLGSTVKIADVTEYSLWRLPASLDTSDLDASFSKLVARSAVPTGPLPYPFPFADAGQLARNWTQRDGLDPARWYVLPDPGNPAFPTNQNQHFTESNTIRIALGHGSVLSGTPVSRHENKVPGQNAWVDFRGTELLFDGAANASFFREPTPLCLENQPAGSNFRAGADNFFSAYPYSGGIDDGFNHRWIGFSLGEAPSQFIAAYRIEAGEANVQETDPPSTDYYGRKKVRAVPTKAPEPVAQTPTGNFFFTDPLAPVVKPYFRFFAFPVNMLGITDDHFLTVQVQFKDVNGVWVTYDERYVKIGRAASSQTPVILKRQLTPVVKDTGTSAEVSWSLPPGNFKVNGTTPIGPQMGWGAPLVSSFDPRSSRFGHPSRGADGSQAAVYGTQSQRAMFNPVSATDPGVFGPGGKNATNRFGTDIINSFSANAAPNMMTATYGVPAAWNLVDQFTWAFPNVDLSITPWGIFYPLPYRTLFRALVGDNAADNALLAPPDGFYSPWRPGGRTAPPYWAQWWAQGKFSGVELWRLPSVNANDYGWFSRAPIPAQATDLFTYTTAAETIAKGTFSNNSVSNFKRNWYWHILLPGKPGFCDEADALRMGSLAENILPKYADTNDPLAPASVKPEFRQAYADPDDVVRRAMGAFAAYGGYSSSTLDGLPEGQVGTSINKDSRPVVLNRPFQSVADMGYAFRGSPWKNLSFSTAETGDAALLDVFCITEPPPFTISASSRGSVEKPANPLVAGKVNLNTRQEPVLKALLNGALKDEVNGQAPSLSTEATLTAQTLIGRTTSSKAWLGPLCNVSELAGKLFGKDLAASIFNLTTDPVYTSIVYKTDSEPERNPDMSGPKLTWHYTGVSADLDSIFTSARDQKNLRMRESVIRGLSGAGQTRVWNIMLDLIVQTGKFLPGTSDLSKFTRESERRVWIFLAIDRLTGELLDQQVEDVPD